MPTEIELDLPDHMWKSRAEAAEVEVERLRQQNRELITEIKIREEVISGLQDMLAARS